MAIEIVDLPSYKMVDLSIVMGQFAGGCIYIYMGDRIMGTIANNMIIYGCNRMS